MIMYCSFDLHDCTDQAFNNINIDLHIVTAKTETYNIFVKYND